MPTKPGVYLQQPTGVYAGGSNNIAEF